MNDYPALTYDAARVWNSAVDQRGHLRGPLKEAKMLKRFDDPVASSAPGKGMILVARRRFTAGNEVYQVGTPVEPAALGRNFQSFLNNRFVAWVPAPDKRALKAMPQPVELPKPAPAQKPNPRVVLSNAHDPVEAWRESLATMTGKCSGDRARATDILLRDERGSELYLRAQRVFYQRASGGVASPW